MTRSAPVGPQLDALLPSEAGAAKGSATNRGKPDSPATSKVTTQFSSLLGRLVEKKEKSDAKPAAEPASLPFASESQTLLAQPKRELTAFGLGNAGGDGVPSSTNNLPTQTAQTDSQITGDPSQIGGQISSLQRQPGRQLESSIPSASIAYGAPRPRFAENTAPPSAEFSREETDKQNAARFSSELPNSDSAIQISPDPGQQQTVLSAPGSNTPQDSQGVSLLQDWPKFNLQPNSDTAEQLTPSTREAQVLAQLSATKSQPDLAEKPVLSRMKPVAGGLRAHSAELMDPAWGSLAFSKTESMANDTESGASGGDQGADGTPAHPQQSENSNAPQGISGEPPSSGGLAFAARLVPIPEMSVAAANSGMSAQSSSIATANQSGASQSSGGTAEISKESFKDDQAGDQIPAATSASVVSGLTASAPQAVPVQTQNSGSSEVRPDDKSSPLPTAKDVQPSGTALEAQTGPGSPARDIHLQLNQGDQRVDVRLSERSGEVHVAVRTPDSQLAGALRDDLPRLSDRLEQSGFRAETWHAALPGMASGGERRLEASESSFRNAQDSGQRQEGQENQQQQQQQHQQARQPKPGTAQNSNSQRKDFQWLMSQLP